MQAPIRGWAIAAAAYLAGGCADLPDIAPHTCGNGVLEANEECESAEAPLRCGAPDTVNQCRYVCAGGASCPAGYGCGNDGVCRHGDNMFDEGPGSPYRVEAFDFSTGDVDGDGFPDLVG